MNLNNLDDSPENYNEWEKPIPKLMSHIILFM